MKTAVFGAPIPAGTKVGVTNPDGGFLMLAKVRRSIAGMVYDVEVKDGSSAVAAFEDVVRFR